MQETPNNPPFTATLTQVYKLDNPLNGYKVDMTFSNGTASYVYTYNIPIMALNPVQYLQQQLTMTIKSLQNYDTNIAALEALVNNIVTPS